MYPKTLNVRSAFLLLYFLVCKSLFTKYLIFSVFLVGCVVETCAEFLRWSDWSVAYILKEVHNYLYNCLPSKVWILSFPTLFNSVIKASSCCRSDFWAFLVSSIKTNQSSSSQDCQGFFFFFFKLPHLVPSLWLLSFVSSSAFLICCLVC